MAIETVPQELSEPGKRTLAEERASLIFGEIAELAQCVERMGVLLIAEPEDERDAQAYMNAVKQLSCQIGLLSDFGAKVTGGSGYASFEEWMLPPVYPHDEQRKEVRHG